MASTNQSLTYQKAQGKFLAAKTDEERLEALEEMIRECPKHKSSENMLANLKTRHKKLKAQLINQKKSKKSRKIGIKKEEMQAVIVGETNTGKSSLLNLLTNASPEIASYNFTTKHPIVAMMPFLGMNIQLIENPAIESEYYDKGLTHSADVLLILVDKLEQIKKIEDELVHVQSKKIIVFNDKGLTGDEKRKLESTLKSNRLNYLLINTKTKENIKELKEKIFQSFGKIRVYTKEPGKVKSETPIILEPGATVKNVAEKILHGFSSKVKETKIWGPSSKFPGQIVGLNHALKDLDVVEFKTR